MKIFSKNGRRKKNGATNVKSQTMTTIRTPTGKHARQLGYYVLVATASAGQGGAEGFLVHGMKGRKRERTNNFGGSRVRRGNLGAHDVTRNTFNNESSSLCTSHAHAWVSETRELACGHTRASSKKGHAFKKHICKRDAVETKRGKNGQKAHQHNQASREQ